MRQGKWMRGLLAAIGVCVAPLAGATIFTIEAQGTISTVSAGNGLLPAAFAAAVTGDSFRVRYVVDNTAITDSNPSADTGLYNSALLQMTVRINGTSFTVPTNFNASRTVQVFDDRFLGSFGVFRDSLSFQVSGCQTSASGLCSLARVLYFNAETTDPVTPFTDDSFKLMPGDLSQYDVATMEFSIGPGPTISAPVFDQIFGVVTSVAVISPVPQPASAWLLLSGLAGLALTAGGRRPVRVLAS